MEAPSSRLHRMCGCGCPRAAQVNDAFEPSRTTVSVLESLSTISGGTTGNEIISLLNVCSILFRLCVYVTNNFDVGFLVAHGVGVDLNKMQMAFYQFSNNNSLFLDLLGTCKILDPTRRRCWSSAPNCVRPLEPNRFGNFEWWLCCGSSEWNECLLWPRPPWQQYDNVFVSFFKVLTL